MRLPLFTAEATEVIDQYAEAFEKSGRIAKPSRSCKHNHFWPDCLIFLVYSYLLGPSLVPVTHVASGPVNTKEHVWPSKNYSS